MTEVQVRKKQFGGLKGFEVTGVEFILLYYHREYSNHLNVPY